MAVAVPYIAYAAIAAAVTGGTLLISSALRPRPKSNIIDDSRQPTLSERGAYVPRLLGRHLVSPVVTWVGGRSTKTESSGGGKGFGGGGTGVTIYREDAMHCLCIGPGSALYAIHQSGKRILDRRNDPITPDDTPSGSTIELDDDQGSVTIYWGEHSQPVNSSLGRRNHVGARSSWPNIMYVEWNNKRLGTTPNWPELRYDISVGLADPQGCAEDEPSHFMAQSVGDGDEGINPGFAIVELACAPYPHGIGMDTQWWSGQSLANVKSVCHTEHLPFNMLITNGQPFDEVLSEMMSELSMLLADKFGRLHPIMIREVNWVETSQLGLSLTENRGDPEIEQQQGDIVPDRFIFELLDVKKKFRKVPIKMDDDAAPQILNAPKHRTIALPYVTARSVGYKIARRRVQEEGVSGQKWSWKSLHGTRKVFPGMPLRAIIDTSTGDLGRFRVASVKPRFDSSITALELIPDAYSVATGSFYNPNPDEEIDESLAPDLYVFGAELPDDIADTASERLGVARVRANDQIIGALVWISTNGSSYINIGNQNEYASGGTLNAPILDTDGTVETYGTVIHTGPTITAYNEDIADVLDLSSNEEAWKAGEQIAVIGNEWYHLKRVTQVSGGWRLEGLLRAQYGTAAANHAANAPVVIFRRSTQNVFQHPLIVSGATVYVKTQPYTDESAVSLGDVTPVIVSIP